MLRMHGMAETGTATAACVTVECELANYEEVSGQVESGQVESARIVTAVPAVENAKIYGLVDDIRNVFTIVVLMDANEDDQALAYAANGLAFHGNRRLRHALYEGPQILLVRIG